MRTFCLKIFFLIILAMPCVAKAQLIITRGADLPTSWTADSIVSNVLLGEGVEVSNAKFNGSGGRITCNAIGIFRTGDTATNLGLTSGLILATGDVTLAGQRNRTSYASMESYCRSYPIEPMKALAGNFKLEQCAVLEFDFVSRADSIEFDFVFGSEEYPERVCTETNDLFGFFLTGPNPGGEAYNNTNLAIVPDTNLPISINYLNGGAPIDPDPNPNPNPDPDPNPNPGPEPYKDCIRTTSPYYVNNEEGHMVEYDGFTKVLTVKALIRPCAKYHLAIAISDLIDGQWDSGVFLKAGSLKSNSISYEFRNTSNPNAPNEVYEGCCLDVLMRIPEPEKKYRNIAVQAKGTATNGVDFRQLQPSVSLPAYMDTTGFTICPFLDDLDEPTESVKLFFTPNTWCVNADSIEFFIIDNKPIHLSVTRDSLTSSSLFAKMRANVTGGMPYRRITWYNLRTGTVMSGDSVVVTALDSAYYRVVVEDNCGYRDDDTVFVGVLRKFATMMQDTLLCSGELLDIAIGNADSCVVSEGDMAPFSLRDTIVRVSPSQNTMYKVKAYKWWHGQWWEHIDSFTVGVVPRPTLHLTSSKNRVCSGDTVKLVATADCMVSWDNGETYGSQIQFVAHPVSDTTLYVYGKSDTAFCVLKDSVQIKVDTLIPLRVEGDEGVCDGDAANLMAITPSQSLQWTAAPPDLSLSGQEMLKNITVRPSGTTIYKAIVVNGACVNSVEHSVGVEAIPTAVGTVTPATVTLGSMEAVFINQSTNAASIRWQLPDGSTEERSSFLYVVPSDLDSLPLKLWAYNNVGCFDTTTVTVYVDRTTLWIPNSFTPDERTNRTFQIKLNNVRDYHLFIYDRKGMLVFESKDMEQPWNGTYKNGEKCPQETYIYVVSYHKNTYPYEQIVQKGTVLLLR